MKTKNSLVVVAVANKSGAMEADTIENGRSSKSQRSRENILRRACFALLAFCFVLSSCSSPETDGIKAAKMECDCKENYYGKFNEVYEKYITNYDTYSFETQTEAKEKLSEYLEALASEEDSLNVCLNNASEYRIKLEEQFTGKAKKQKFLDAYNATENELNASPQKVAYKNYQERIETMIGAIEPLYKKIVGQWSCEYFSRMSGKPYTRTIIFSPNGTVRDNYNEIIEHRYYDVEKAKNKAYKIVFFNLDRNKKRIYEMRINYDGGDVFEYDGYGSFVRRR